MVAARRAQVLEKGRKTGCALQECPSPQNRMGRSHRRRFCDLTATLAVVAPSPGRCSLSTLYKCSLSHRHFRTHPSTHPPTHTPTPTPPHPHPHPYTNTNRHPPLTLTQSYSIEPPTTTQNTKHQKMQTKVLALVFLTASSVFAQSSQPDLG